MTEEKSEADQSSLLTDVKTERATILLEQMDADVLCHGPIRHSFHKIENRTAFMNDLHTHVASRLFRTTTQNQIFSILWSQVDNLCKGNYKGTHGLCATTMVGAKGIGKTATLKIFNATAKYAFENLIELYISMNNILSKGCPMQTSSILDIVADELERIGITFEDDVRLPMLAQRIIAALSKAGVYLHICVDELDQAYKVNGKVYPAVVRSLHDLVYLGNQPSGRIAVLVCSSSAMIENLITSNADGRLRDDFVLLKTGATNLNDNKFITKRVYSTTPVDLDEVAKILDLPFDDNNKPYLRLVAYSSGCFARNVERVVKESYPEHDLLGVATPEKELPGGRFLLWNKIMKQLKKKNRTLCADIFPVNASIQTVIRNIISVAWEEKFTPLNFDEVHKIWLKLIKKNRLDASENLIYNILHFADQNWITFDGIRNGRPHRIYPFSMASLGSYILDERNGSDFSQQIQQYISEGTSAVEKLANNPCMIVANGTLVGAASYGCCIS
mmetsp:Transcript_12188/g.18415  ORF Transcript_12188/g.18415 Transcript_12188/m.18415 type:complete len:503 (+) Transcript_12188:189-1697(+)